MLRCCNCQCQLKFDPSIIERYPDWQNFSALSKPALAAFGKSSTTLSKNTSAPGHSKDSLLFSTFSNLSRSQTSDASQQLSKKSFFWKLFEQTKYSILIKVQQMDSAIWVIRLLWLETSSI